jgi:hypothetical protein
MLNQDIMREATRLTRAGRLIEATALLQRTLRGEPTAKETSGTSTGGPHTGREPPILDAKTEPVDKTGSQLATPPSQPRMLRAFLDPMKMRSGVGQPYVGERAPPSLTDIVPEGTRFIEGTFSNAVGSRAYRLFIPSRYEEGRPLPLVVMLHGCTQSPEDFAAGTRMNFIAEEQPCFVVYPAQSRDANPAKCWNWFRTTDQQRGKGEPSLIAGITRQIMREYPIDQKRRSGCCCYHGSNVQRSICGNRHTFWTCLWGRR